MRFLTLILIFNLSQIAYGAVLEPHESIVCPSKTNWGMGVTCCLKDQSVCKKVLEQDFMESVLERSLEVVSNYNDGKYSFGAVPNCHWTTYAHLTKSTPSHLTVVADYTLWNWGFNHGKEVSRENALPGDVVFFVFKGTRREDVVVDNVPKWVWRPIESFEHSAILVGQDVIFQKENLGTQVFSIANVNETLKSYQSDFLSRNRWVKGHFELIYIRRNPTVSFWDTH